MNIMGTAGSQAYSDLVPRVMGARFEVSNVLGGGFLGKVYERALVEELQLRGLQAQTQVPILVSYKGNVEGEYVCDVLVEGTLIIELKCCEKLADEHIAQCNNYMRATGSPLMVLINFQNPRLE